MVCFFCFLLVICSYVFSAEIYVSTNGNDTAGTNWATAYTNLVKVLNNANDGDIILLAGQKFSLTNVLYWNKKNLTMQGGYEAIVAAGPGPRDITQWPTVLTRRSGTIRIMYIQNITNAMIDGVIISNGYMQVVSASTVYDGAGVRVETCTNITFRGCKFVNNTLYNSTDHYQGRGGGVFIWATSLIRFESCLFSNNYSYGDQWHNRAYAGGIFAGNSSGIITNCVFNYNRVYAAGGNFSYTWARAGGLYISGGNLWHINRTVFHDNRATHLRAATAVNGGAVYIDGTPSVKFRNCLFSANKTLNYGDGIYVDDGNVQFDFCTIVTNAGYGIYRTGGAVIISNSIFWANGDDLFQVASTNIRYSRVEKDDMGFLQNNFTNIPVFADTSHWHLASKGGHYINGWFSGGVWTNSFLTSPLIDKADPLRQYENEPNPHGYRANPGAYGNTPVASKTFLEEPGIFTALTVHAYSATQIKATSAVIRAEVVHKGEGSSPFATFCWGTNDYGTISTANWQNVIQMGVREQWELFESTLTGLSTGMTYYYRCYVTNNTGSDWSLLSSFTTLTPPVITNNGAVFVRRRSALLAGRIINGGGESPRMWLYYWISGGSTNKVDLGYPSSNFTATVSNLIGGTAYSFNFLGSNTAGLIGWSGIKSFTTLTAGPIAWYASTNGNNSFATNWATAITGAQAVINIAEPGDTVYFAGHTFASTNPIILSVSRVTLMGGYAATNNDSPGERDASRWQTVFKRSSGTARILWIRNLTNVVVDGITIRDGYSKVVSASTIYDGAGIRVQSTTNVEIRNCRIINNTLYNSTDHYQGRGAGLFVTASSGFRLLDSIVSGNYSYGDQWHNRGYAGGFYGEGGSGIISNCMFISNRARAAGGNFDYTYSRAGAIYINGGNWQIFKTVMISNTAEHGYAGAYYTRGGACYIEGAGSVLMRNCLIARNDSLYQGDGIFITGGNVSMELSTVVSNKGYGVYRTGGTVAIDSSILWGNGDDLYGITDGVIYSCVENGDFNQTNGCVMVNPLFHDTTYFHLGSRAGTYLGGYFSGGTWGYSPLISPLIDAGNPSLPFANEPMPNGGRVNMGAYGNTQVASKKVLAGSVFMIK